MIQKIALSVILAVGCMAGAPVMAAPITIASGPGNATCTLGPGSGTNGDSCTTAAISVHPAWQANNPSPPDLGGVWVSYADTGPDGTTLAPRNGSSQNPDGEQVIMTLVESFTVNRAATIDVRVWADDTAGVTLREMDGTVLEQKAPNFTQDTCADGPIGCEPPEAYQLLTSVGPGSYELAMDFYQVGDGETNASNPFGGLYAGQVSVPVPAGLALFGTGLLGLGVLGARSRGSR